MTDAELDELADRIADRLVARGAAPSRRIVDAAGLAAELKVSPDWVYANQHELGALALPSKRGRGSLLRFDLDQVLDRLRLQPEVAAAPTRPRGRRALARQASKGPLIEFDEG